MKIGERKARLAPIIKELRPLRQRGQEMQAEHDERKRYVHLFGDFKAISQMKV